MGVAEHFGGGTRLFDAPVVKHEDAVGDVLHHAEIVGDHDDGGARPGLTDSGEGVEDLDARGHVDGAHWFVGEDYLGLVDDGAGDDHALRLATRQIDWVPVQEVRRFKTRHGQSRDHPLVDIGVVQITSLQTQRFSHRFGDLPTRVE